MRWANRRHAMCFDAGMRAGEPSRTAEYMALFCAVESHQPADRRLCRDRLAAGFLTPSLGDP